MDDTRASAVPEITWSAVWIAGLAASLVFLLLGMLFGALAVGAPWLVFRLLGSIILGEGVLPPPPSFELSAVLVALVLTLATGLLATLILVLIIHRWGLIVGVLGGALYGVVLYIIAYYGAALVAPWLESYRSWVVAVPYVLFGAVAGAVYELLDVDVGDAPEIATAGESAGRGGGLP